MYNTPPPRRFMFIKVKLGDQMMTISSICAPNYDQIPFIKYILDKLASFQEGHTLIGEDLNTICDYKMEKTSFTNRAPFN